MAPDPTVERSHHTCASLSVRRLASWRGRGFPDLQPTIMNRHRCRRIESIGSLLAPKVSINWSCTIFTTAGRASPTDH